MSRTTKRLFALNDQMAALQEERRLVAEELQYHRHLNDDAQRDAVVSDHAMDRADARVTEADVARFERHLDKLDRMMAKLEARRNTLLAKLSD